MMMMRILIPALLAVLAAPAQSAAPPRKAPAAAPKPLPAQVRVQLLTSAGPILLELEREKAPLTVANFLKYVDAGRLTGAEIYRAMKYGPQEESRTGLIQGKARWDGRNIIPPVKHEPTTQTGLLHVDGTISMARGALDTATSDFFIVLGAMPALDAQPMQGGDNQGFAAFGRVVEGMDIVRKIHAASISATKGEGVMKGQILEAPVKILSGKRVPLPPKPVIAPAAP